MKNRLFSLICLTLVFSLLATPVSAQDTGAESIPETKLAEHVPGELLIRFAPGLDAAQRTEKMAAMDVSLKREIMDIGVQLVNLPPGLSVEQAMEQFNHMPGIDFVEPNYILHIVANSAEEIVDQWALNTMHVPQAWETLEADERGEVLIATVDTGIDRNRSDLSQRIYYFPDEIPSDGVDNDGNGYVDDTWGWDFVNNDNDPIDDNMHGTAVSGVMVAELDGEGVVGVCPWCRVMAVKVMSSQGSGTLDVVASGITYAANNGAKVINLSLGATAGAQTLEDAINYAWMNGAVIFAAAGNNGSNTILYPAGYANAVAVASTNAEDKHSCFSNYGDGYIAVAAPGEAIYVIDINNATGYGTYSGTSLSTPHASGLAGLLLGMNPGLSNADVRAIIQDTAVDLGSAGVDGVFGHGRIDAYRAVIGDTTPVPPPDSLSSNDGTATGFPHARKLVRDSSGTLHVIWHTYDGSLYRIRYATSGDNGATWKSQQDVFQSPYESYHPALAIDADNLYVVIPSRSGDNLPYQIFFTSKSLTGDGWSDPQAIISGNFDAVRPEIFLDPTNGRLHVIASSYDNAPSLYYRSSDTQGTDWNNLVQFNPSNTTDNRTIYAAIYAHGDNLYVVTRTVQTLFYFINYLNVFTVRSTDGGLTWIEQTQISAHMALYTGEYGISLAGVGDRIYMGYEVGTSLYFRRNDGAGWSDYLTLETGDTSNVYKWPSITQSADGQAWMLFELNGQMYKRYYDGTNWQAKELVGRGTYPNLKLGTSEARVEWVYTICNGSPFDIAYGSINVLDNLPPQALDQNIYTNISTPVGITLTATDPDGDPLTFSILSNPSHGTLTGTPPTMTYTPASGYIGMDSFTFKANDGSLDSNVATVWITINPVNSPPVVTTHPVDQTVNSGQTASFTSFASGYPVPSVQWQVSTDGGSSWNNIAGATSTTYAFTTQPADNGKQFHAVFSNSIGSATSNAAVLTVNYAPVVTTHPDNQTVTPGQIAIFKSYASGNPTPAVQWQVSSDGISWGDIAGATFTTYTFVAQAEDNGKQFRAVFTNSAGSATSNPATLTVDIDSIFMDDFNSCNADAWSGTINDPLLAFNIASGRNSTCGMAVSIASYTPAYTIDLSPNGETSFRARFYFNPSTLKIAKNDLITIFTAYDTSEYSTLSVQIRYSGGAFQIRASVKTDRSRWIYSGWTALNQASSWHPIEVYWKTATAPGANNGSLTLWLDGAQASSSTGVDNDQQNIGRVTLGVIAGMDDTTQGKCLFDDYISRRLTYIGP